MMAGVTTLRLLAAAPLLLLAACGDGGEPATVAGMRLMDGGRVEVVVESGACTDPGSAAEAGAGLAIVPSAGGGRRAAPSGPMAWGT